MPADENMKIEIIANGPYRVTGSVPLAVQTIVADQRGDSDRLAAGGGPRYP